MTYSLPTFQTAGYVKPYPLASDVSLITRSAITWQQIDRLSSTDTQRNECYDNFKTHIHSLMHNRSHQAEY